MKSSKLVSLVAVAASLAIGSAWAMGGNSGGGSPPQPSGDNWPRGAKNSPAPKPDEYDQAVKLIKEDKCADALPLLQKAAEKSPKDADIYNYLGFCLRKTGKLNESFDNYKTALTIDPNHRGAREYVGELFLMMNRLDLAQQQLDQLKQLCPRGCDERDTLAKSIEEYKKAHPEAPKAN